MGGYGVTAVHGIVQGLTAVAGIGGLYSWKRGGGVNEDESSNVEVEEIEGEVEGGDWESVDTTEYDEDAEESVGLKAFGL